MSPSNPSAEYPPALRRRIPRYSDLAPLMQFKKPMFSQTRAAEECQHHLGPAQHGQTPHPAGTL